MKTRFRLSLLTAAWLALMPAAFAQEAPAEEASAPQPRTLYGMDFTALEGDRVLLTLTLTQPALEPVVFTVDKPARLSVDLPETALALAERTRVINVGAARNARAVEAQGRTRIVVELTSAVPYRLRTEGNQVLLEIQSKAGAKTGLAGLTAAAPTVVGTAPAAPTGEVSNVDFRRGDKGEGRVIIGLSDARMPADVREEGGRVLARFRGATVPEALLRRLDVLDFATPVKFIDVKRGAAGGVDVLITPADGAAFEQAAYQSGSNFTVELQPLSAEKLEEKKKEQPQYTGERITLSFQSVDVRSLLQIIADVAGTNLVVSDTVQGEVAMRLENVPWDQALDIILRTKGLGLRQQGNVMLVAPLEELAAREKAELEVAKSKVELAPLRSEIIQVNYAKSSDIAALLKSGDSSLLSERGKVSVDERTNTLLVLETRDKLTDIRALVARLDIPVRQVLIESRIVIANSDYSREIGTRFGVTSRGLSDGRTLTSSGSADVVSTVSPAVAGVPVATPAFSDRFNVNLPATGAGTPRAAFAILGNDFLVDLELSALQAEGRGELVSSPRIITANSKEATIKSGFEVPFVTPASGNSPPTVSFKEALLSLNVTPFINPDNSIVMDLKVNRDEPDFTRAVQGNPPLNKREIQTNVLVQNGETVVLGGIYEQRVTEQESKVPLLGDIPLLGALFRRSANVSSKNELLIFVTPKILSEGLSVE